MFDDIVEALVTTVIGAAIIIAIVGLVLSNSPAKAAAPVCGEASWYGGKHHGRRTASGEIFDQWAMTAAMPDRSMLGERVRVTRGGYSVVVRITDLGPAKYLDRVIDLSHGAAQKLHMVNDGHARVCVERLNG